MLLLRYKTQILKATTFTNLIHLNAPHTQWALACVLLLLHKEVAPACVLLLLQKEVAPAWLLLLL